jgi:hypothetical protein
MAGLPVSRGPREENIGIRRITALGASKGRYVSNLRRLLAAGDVEQDANGRLGFHMGAAQHKGTWHPHGEGKSERIVR